MKIKAWIGHKRFRAKDVQVVDYGKGGGGSDMPGNFEGQNHSNDTRASTTDAVVRLNSNGKTASVLRFMGHTLSDNRHGLTLSAAVTTADGHAKRVATDVMIADAQHAAGDQA